METSEREELARSVAEMGRDKLIASLRRMRCRFQLDFTDDFLRSASLERLRHIVLAASLHAVGRSPSPA